MENDESLELSIDLYTHGTWTKIPDPFADETDVEAAWEKAGFDQFDRFGTQHGSAITVYIGNDNKNRFLVNIDSGSLWQPLMVADLPSLISLMNQLASWVNIGIETRKLEMMEEFSELLLQFGESGPLAECLGARRAYYARLRQERLERERKEKERTAQRTEP